ncbi:MAG: hypothetical protein HOI19_02955 [Rhodospirillaceae bacterium]|nr:hypothetical protein [Rhodospirillaceae bacterium]
MTSTKPLDFAPIWPLQLSGAELPDIWVTTGSLIVIASGLYILHRELVVRRARSLS